MKIKDKKRIPEKVIYGERKDTQEILKIFVFHSFLTLFNGVSVSF